VLLWTSATAIQSSRCSCRLLPVLYSDVTGRVLHTHNQEVTVRYCI